MVNRLRKSEVTISDEILDQWFDLADVDKNGVVDQQEAENFMKDKFMKMLQLWHDKR